ncbi:MAG: hypothetical protein ABI140_05160 [Jatrophihabitantaceae bacterium]
MVSLRVAAAVGIAGLLSAVTVGASPAQAATGDYLDCFNAYQNAPIPGYYVDCTLNVVTGPASQQDWVDNGTDLGASGRNEVTPACVSGQHWHITVTYLDGNNVAGSLGASGTCGSFE